MQTTICALATPPGISGLAIIRVSGEKAFEIVDKHFIGKTKIADAQTHTIHYGKFASDNKLIDNVTVAVFRKPNSYTGEDVAEIGCHGGIFVYQEILNALLKSGAELAKPGEFTRRAFINGRMDLLQVEAVADLIHSASVQGIYTSARQLEGGFKQKLEKLRTDLIDSASLLELELDFADEDIDLISKEDVKKRIQSILQFCEELASSYRTAEIYRSGFFIGIAGYPNSGKSTLFNAMLKRQRAIVSDIPGTTRDYLEEHLTINGITVKLVDTAGIRETEDIIEIEGMKFVDSILKQSNLILVINDISKGENHSDQLLRQIMEKNPTTPIYLLQNKIDLITQKPVPQNNTLYISAKHNIGIEQIYKLIEELTIKTEHHTKDILINQRHYLLLNKAIESLKSAIEAIEANRENEIIALDIKEAINTLGEITGTIWNEDILNNIFSKFCIGK